MELAVLPARRMAQIHAPDPAAYFSDDKGVGRHYIAFSDARPNPSADLHPVPAYVLAYIVFNCGSWVRAGFSSLIAATSKPVRLLLLVRTKYGITPAEF